MFFYSLVFLVLFRYWSILEVFSHHIPLTGMPEYMECPEDVDVPQVDFDLCLIQSRAIQMILNTFLLKEDILFIFFYLRPVFRDKKKTVGGRGIKP